jgi:hypothetical protein
LKRCLDPALFHVIDPPRSLDNNLWADDQVRELLASLIDEEFGREVLQPYGSIRSLVTKIVLVFE